MWIAGLLGIPILGVFLFIAARLYLLSVAERALLKSVPPGNKTPADSGLEYQELRIPNGARQLHAWFVPAGPANDSNQAVLIFHGNKESVADWLPVLAFLNVRGISSMVFDYSGFGASGGKATVRNLKDDVLVAYHAFTERTGGTRRRYLLAFSLGTGFLLEQASRIQDVQGIILVAPYSSARALALHRRVLPSNLAFLLPDIYNNVRAVRALRVPLLLVHSRDDKVFPLEMAEQVAAAARDPKRLVVLRGLRHNGLLEDQTEEYMAPVIRFLQEQIASKH